MMNPKAPALRPSAASVHPVPSLWLAFGFGLILTALFVASPRMALFASLALLACAAAVCYPGPLMVATFALTPFQQSLLGEEAPCNLCAADICAALLAAAIIARCIRNGRVEIGPVGIPLFFFFSVACTSALLTWHGPHTVMALVRFARGTLAAVLLFANGDARPDIVRRCFLAFLLGINALSVCSLFAFARGGIQASMYTLGIHKNALGPTFGCGIVIALALLFAEAMRPTTRLWLLASVAGAMLGSLLSLSRGGWIATLAGVVLVVATTGRWRAATGGALVCLPLLVVLWQFVPSANADYARDLSSDAYNVRLRVDAMNTTLQAFQSSPLFGTGVDYAYTLDPHNVFVLTLAETGIVGLLAFFALFAGGFSVFLRAAKRNPSCRSLALAGAGVLLVSLVAAAFDVYWRRGVGLMGWACVGLMAAWEAQTGEVLTTGVPAHAVTKTQ